MKPTQHTPPEAGTPQALGRRELLTRGAPACALACLGLARLPHAVIASMASGQQDVHKFDAKRSRELSVRDVTRMENEAYIDFIRTLRTEVGDERTIGLLNANSAAMGRRAAEAQARGAKDRSFRSFTAQFRPPRYASVLTHEVVEDTEHAFGLRVTECVWAAVFREAGLGGDIGHAAICNMDYHWPPAFNPKFGMERDRTLMQGHDHCNHRYLSGE